MNTIIIVALLFVSGSAHCQSSPGKIYHGQSDTSYVYGTKTREGTGKYFMEREIAMVMSAAGAYWLERSEREMEENTELAINSMRLKPGDVVADIGAGTGFYTFRIAKRVTDGKIFAVELQDDLITHLAKRKKELKASNVEVIKGIAKDVNLPGSTVDLAIMVDVYHELEWPKEVISSVCKSLKSNGRILLIEYKGEDPNVPIKPLHKMTVAQVNKEMRNHGFEPDLTGDFLPIQHFLLYKKIISTK